MKKRTLVVFIAAGYYYVDVVGKTTMTIIQTKI